MKLVVEIDSVLWTKVRNGDAFQSDEEALAEIIASSLLATGKVRSTSELLLAANKIKVVKQDS